MSGFRFMRVIVFFDLPTITSDDRRNYREFRKCLIKNGFIMLQESVYCKMITSPSVEKSVYSLLLNNKPDNGLVQSLVVTENQFSKMKYISGKRESDVIDTEDKVIIL